jgi:biopolymer transport protein ExbD
MSAAKFKPSRADGGIRLDMTPLIDVVFQLLTFFVFTLRIVAQEGDFDIKMPLSAPPAAAHEQLLLPVKLHLVAGDDGSCADIILNDRSLGGGDAGFARLHEDVAELVRDGNLDRSAEVELNCDYSLKYENVIRAITAVSGERRGSDVIKLIERIKFSPPKPPPAE